MARRLSSSPCDPLGRNTAPPKVLNCGVSGERRGGFELKVSGHPGERLGPLVRHCGQIGTRKFLLSSVEGGDYCLVKSGVRLQAVLDQQNEVDEILDPGVGSTVIPSEVRAQLLCPVRSEIEHGEFDDRQISESEGATQLDPLR